MVKLSQEVIDRLKALLDAEGELPPELRWTLFPDEKQEYELVYAGKQPEQAILAHTMAVPLQAIRAFNNGSETEGWTNRLIFGDNLQAMQALRDDPAIVGQVKLVYIDPPFATRQDFRGSEEQRAYQDKVAGATFIEFIRARLILIRELLHPAGSLYIHLDWRKCHYLKAILDEVFGEHRFMSQIIWQRHDPHNDAVKRYGRVHDVIYWYANQERPTYNASDIVEGLSPQAINEYSLVEQADGSVVSWQGQPLQPGDRRFKLDDCTVKGTNRKRKFTWRGATPPAKRQWPVDSPEEMDARVADGLYYLRNPERGAQRCRKSFLDRRTEEGQLAQDIWLNLGRMKGGSSYPTEKPEVLLERIIRASSDPGDLVMDAFAGSGTTPAVAEKLGRRWIAIDCGKLAIYTIQKRMLNLRAGIGNREGQRLAAKPFTLYNAGLYDFASLKELPWEGWRFFALQLFECRDKPGRLNGLHIDGEKRGAPVLVFNWKEHPDEQISEETIDDIHAAVGRRIGRRFYIIAPMLAFDFHQDFIDRDGVRYYALRIPYSMIHELHSRDFQAVLQAREAGAVNDIQDAYGFSFMVPPEVEFTAALEKPEGEMLPYATIRTEGFTSRAKIKGSEREGGKDTFAMLLVDVDYNGEVFELDHAFYGGDLELRDWTARFDPQQIGKQVMAVWVDHHGNEFKAVIPRESFGLVPCREQAAEDRAVASLLPV